MKEIKIVLDNSVLEKYNLYYFSQHPRAKKEPIEHPWHPSINVWFVMQRPQMNSLKQKWKDFIIWVINDLGYQDSKFDLFDMEYIVYMPTKRRIDPDNISPKFINDGLVESGFIVDDDGKHMRSLILRTEYDKEYPRSEIYIRPIEKKEQKHGK